MKLLLAVLILVTPSAYSATKDISVCEALLQLTKLDEQELSLVGELSGGFYHGFGLFGKPDLKPCAERGRGFRSPSSVGLIFLNFASPDGSVSRMLTEYEHVLKTRGVGVRVIGVLKTKPFYYNLCLKRDSCFSNGFLGVYPAMVIPRSIEILDPKLVKER